jgi:hypothetical protein
MIDVIELRTCSIFIDEKGICIIDVKQMTAGMITKQDANETCETINRLCKGEKTPIIFDMTKFEGQLDQGVRAIFRNHEKLAPVKLVTTVITSSLGNSLMANLYVKINKPLTPMRVFSKKEEALKWMEEMSVEIKEV